MTPDLLINATVDNITSFLAGLSVLSLIFWLSVLMFLNSFIMIPPSQYICMAAGIAAAKNQLSLLLLILVAAFANLIGTSVWYAWGRLGWFDWLVSRPILRLPIIRSYFRFLPKIRPLFQRRAVLAVCLWRLAPIARSVVSLPAGDVKMSFLPFMLSSFAGICIWCALWVSIGTLVERLHPLYVLGIAITVGLCSLIAFVFIDHKLSEQV